jgi:ATP-dependent Lhr-like helicase
MPLSSELSTAVRHKLTEYNRGVIADPEMEAMAPLLELQRKWSRIPEQDELLVEQLRTREGYHTYIHSFEGRLVHEGLSSLFAYRLIRQAPRSISMSANDYGFELLSHEALAVDDSFWHGLTDTTALLEDLLTCVNNTELARRQFRDIARIAGLVFQGYPGAAKSAKQLQASSELFYDVFLEFDPKNLLLDQARREVLEQQLEFLRLRAAMERMGRCRRMLVQCAQLTPLAFPIWADRLRAQSLTSEKWSDRIGRMIVRLEKKAALKPAGGGARSKANRRARRAS